MRMVEGFLVIRISETMFIISFDAAHSLHVLSASIFHISKIVRPLLSGHFKWGVFMLHNVQAKLSLDTFTWM